MDWWGDADAATLTSVRQVRSLRDIGHRHLHSSRERAGHSIDTWASSTEPTAPSKRNDLTEEPVKA